MLTCWHYHMETLSALLALCEGNPPITGGFPPQRAGNAGFGDFFDVSQNKQLTKHSSRRWFETPWCSLWRQRNVCCWLLSCWGETAWWWCIQLRVSQYTVPLFTKKTLSYIGIGIHIIKLRRSSHRLRFIMGIPIPVRGHLLSIYRGPDLQQ